MSAWTRLRSGPTRRWRIEQRPAGEETAPPPPNFRVPTAEPTPERPGEGEGAKAGRVLFINQYYWPDHASTAQHLTDLAESLAARGYDCHVLCSRGGYKPGQAPRPAREVHNGVTIHRVGATSWGRRTMWRRYADYLSFYARAAGTALRLPRFDAVVTLTTPPIIGLVGTILRKFRKSLHVYWSMDLHPDASLALGLMKRSNPVVGLLAWLSDAVYRRADRVVVLGPYMADRIAAKRARAGRIVTIPVWSRRDEVYPLPRAGHPLRAELGLADRFVAMYSGNLGLAHSADEFLEAARRLKGREDVVFLFVGDGPRMAEVRAAKESEGLDNVRLLDYFPREMLHASLSMADVHLISMRSEMTGIVVPGKLYGVMAAGRPALFVGPDHCETADTIREADCGLTVRLGDPSGVASAIERLASDPDLAARLGRQGREAFLRDHERDNCCAAWVEVLGDLLGQPTPAPEAPATVPMPVPSLSSRAARTA